LSQTLCFARRGRKRVAMKRFPSEGSNAQERRQLIRTQSDGEETSGLAAPAKAMVGLEGGHFLGRGDYITLECLGDKPGPRYLDGRTHNGTVGLAPHTNPPYTGTRWHLTTNSRNVRNPNAAGHFLECLGEESGPRWLDGRTDNGDAVLSPTRSAPYTGTRWWIAVVDQA